MAQPAKYLFENRFDAPPPESRERVEETVARQLRDEFELTLDNARKLSFEEGRRAGEAETLDRLEAKIAETLDNIVTSGIKVSSSIEEVVRDVREDACNIALTAAEKLSHGLINQDPNLQVETIFRENLAHLNLEPRIVIRVADGLADDIDCRASLFASQYGFAGKVQFVGDSDLSPGDFEIEWSCGGIKHRLEAVRENIFKAVSGYLKTFSNTAESEQVIEPPLSYQDRQAGSEMPDSGQLADSLSVEDNEQNEELISEIRAPGETS